MKFIRIGHLSLVPLLISCFGTVQFASAQDLLGSILSGDLVDPTVGSYAWYEVSDGETDLKVHMRIALVDKERIKRKTGYWIETELVPENGVSSIYKILLTGPANDSKHVHRLIVQEGARPAQEMALEDPQEGAAPEAGDREILGIESIKYTGGTIESEHVRVSQGGKDIELWLNETVKPVGLVKMVSGQGEMILQRFGEGGRDGSTAIRAVETDPEVKPERKFRVETEDSVTRNFSGRTRGEEKR